MDVRLANAPMNYTLRRIETYAAMVLLPSNSKGSFDKAFMRRLDLVIDFPLPGRGERRSLWLSHLCADHCLGMSQVNHLAAAVDLGGTHIRNAVLAHAHGTSIDFGDVATAVCNEYRKLGRQTKLGTKR